MNLTKAANICSSLPLLGCVLGTLFHLLSLSPSDSGATCGENMSKGEENDVAAANNAAAQKHFRQLQHIRGA
ncbi:hypothetical protein FH972_007782 [Carpinus fangiana]|jgi:hypothetical protein|uniref:Secreted protein n=1 Tax=Carpinus fangiana TaxID=176857 RepID=A0A5N6QZC9_9ROSI|nr:hypothetical protein FH972_007782 [Carpinus fangiana]